MRGVTGLLAAVLVLAPLPALAGPRDVTKAQKLLDEQKIDEAVAYLQEALRDKQDYETLQALKALLDDALYARADASRAPEAYQAYLEARPSGLHANDARMHLCDGAWASAQAASAETDPAPLVAFARANPDCSQASAATRMATRLAYRAAEAAGTSQAMRLFVAAWPEAPEVDPARAREDDLAYAEAVALGGGDSIEAYLATHPRGRHLAEARAEAEARAWVVAEHAEGAEALEAFLRRFPGSGHGPQARALLRQRGQGLYRVEGDAWGPLGAGEWAPGVVVYKPPPGGAPPAALRVAGLHATLGSPEISPVAFPLGRWAAGQLGIDAAPIEQPGVVAKGPGPDGEFTFTVPFSLPGWVWNGARAVGYELRVLDAQGRVLDRARVEPSPGSPTLGPYYTGGSTGQKNAAQYATDPLYRVALAAMRVQDGDYAGATEAWGAARAAWPDLPTSAPGLDPAHHTGAVYTAHASADAAPGSPGDGFVQLYSAAAGRFSLSAPGNVSGALLLDDGRGVGSARLGTTSANAWRYIRRGAWGGAVTLNRGVSPAGIFGHELFLLSTAERRWSGDTTLASHLDRWPSLRALAGADPARWLETVMAGAGVSKLSRLYDLNGDGLPELIGVSEGRLAVAFLHGDGTVDVARSSVSPWSEPVVSPVTPDLDGDGRPELLVMAQGACNGLQIAIVRHTKGRLLVDEIAFEDICDAY